MLCCILNICLYINKYPLDTLCFVSLSCWQAKWHLSSIVIITIFDNYLLFIMLSNHKGLGPCTAVAKKTPWEPVVAFPDVSSSPVHGPAREHAGVLRDLNCIVEVPVGRGSTNVGAVRVLHSFRLEAGRELVMPLLLLLALKLPCEFCICLCKSLACMVRLRLERGRGLALLVLALKLPCKFFIRLFLHPLCKSLTCIIRVRLE